MRAMALSQRLDLRHSQSLVLTPQLQQAIKLLQLNNLELGEYVEGELSQNPLLDHDEGDGSAVLESVDRDNLLRHETDGGPEPVRDTAERAAHESSAGRRVGKECVSPCRTRWGTVHLNKK